jgi:hypothetical protein
MLVSMIRLFLLFGAVVAAVQAQELQAGIEALPTLGKGNALDTMP